ncbi:MAG: hypothetical protein HY869_17065 [Chloroflexi bacterium]|nr:hypothetical protein [Chloroflexota bacterium]
MAIHYSIKLEGDLLLVDAWGFDENLEEVQAYGQAIIQACLEGGCARVLCNESNLEYRLSTFDIFQSAESIAARVHKPVKTAIVCNEKFITDAQFWETVAVNRGMTVRFFKDMDTARRWLGEG